MRRDFKYNEIEFPPIPIFPENSEYIYLDPKKNETISECLERASFNSTIVIPEGTYNENILIKKRIRLVGEGKVVIKSINSEDSITIDSSAVQICSINILSGNNQASAPVNLLSGSVVLSQCELSSIAVPAILTHTNGTVFCINSQLTSTESPCFKISGRVKVELNNSIVQKSSKCGILCTDSAQLKVINSTIENCKDSGIVALGESYICIQKTQFTNNGGNAVELNTISSENYLKGCAISQHPQGCGIACSGPGKLLAVDCILSGFLAGISLTDGFEATTVNCHLTNATQSALVSATNKSSINMFNDHLTGNCQAGLLATDGASISATNVQIVNVPNCGAIAYSNATLSLMDTAISEVLENGVEIQSDCKFTSIGCTVENVAAIGILVRDNCSAIIDHTKIKKAKSACLHFVNCQKNQINVSQSTFEGSEGNSVNVNQSPATFRECTFSSNQYDGLQLRGKISAQFMSCVFTENKVVGANVVDGAKCHFENCMFNKNSGTGLSIQSSTANCSKCFFQENIKMGLCAFEGSSVSIKTSLFKNNLSFGAQIENEGTSATFENCDFTDHLNSGSVMVSNSPKAVFSKCNFSRNMNSHIESRENATTTIKNCEFSTTKCGIGLMTSLGAKVKIENSKIFDEKQSAIVVGEKGICDVNNCDISNCKISGIAFLQESSGSVSNCKIYKNGACGIQILSPKVSAKNNEIHDNKHFGIRIAIGLQDNFSENNFRNNSEKDISYLT
ncbi:hypothetical protein TVAG_046630 [Trichomonas vaginalis G3]|uniref:Right handed beta helix domain-containing protein n=1 Tax=Trichomonas vaginalis (strain ATCC PRA-98 / G3) TaxID=412133 RepID=A2EAN8_TRIV3|nr:F-box only protein family [Trichomonas vaginalis G3]EAY10241.1 hypothetical protein TVAG_046630 [Trichomonas vaginalis G3]KAI5487723.1 F-box only protein family [Trichomonas vaginalis G3]|eukprot:XP_001322464.1 hypothetical protein [Trichomonas vaginalis G3]